MGFNQEPTMNVDGPVTLGDLDQEGKLLWLYCNDCGYEREVLPLSIGLHAEQPVPTTGKRLKCSKCGSKKISSKPELYPGGLKRAPTGKT